MDIKEKTLKQDSPKGSLIKLNPFPGLRPFGTEESHLFFGREGQSEEVINKLANNRFVAVIGASGTGKSSLIYCGLIPVLYGGFITSAGSQWKIIVTRPGSSPIDNLAESIVKSSEKNLTEEELLQKQNFYSALLRRSSLGLVESLNNIPRSQNDNILLLVDQFEELFRYRLTRKGQESLNESVAYVRLITEAVNHLSLPAYIVITMRSDFIGECSQFQELTDLINRSNYLIPQMTRNDFRDAITGPIAVGGASIEPALVQELLNEVGDNPDQLPILQHAMMRTWNFWLQNSTQDKPVGISEYEAIGKMEKALSEHANEAYDDLSEEGKRICEILFKTITEKGTDNRGVRRPTRLGDIAEIANAREEDVMEVIDKFRITGRSFLTPPHEVPLTSDSIIDLSHESLMRIWNRLKVWVDEESAAVQMYLRLSEASALFQQGKTGLWRPPDLQIALNWEKKQQPTLTWAQRHNPAFERAMVFLHTSEQEYEAEEQNKIKLQKRAIRRTKIFAAVLGSAAVISLGIMLFAIIKQNEAKENENKARINSITANIQKSYALKKTREAQEQRNIAEKQTLEAIKQKVLADKQSTIAQQQRSIAEKQSEIANAKSIEANEQKNLAQKNAKEALDQKAAAEKAKEEALNRRMLSIAQSISIKSLQIDEDKDLKALLAYQAYVFNKRYNGPEQNTDVYGGLYSALSSLNSKGYNIFKAHTDAVNAVAFDHTANIFYSAGGDGKVMKWDIADTTRKPYILMDNLMVNKSLDISIDNRWLAIGTTGKGIIISDLRNNTNPPRYLNNLGKNVQAIKISHDNNLIISASDNNIEEWDIASNSGKIVASTDGNILSLSLSPDSKLIAVGTRNGEIIIINRDNSYSQTSIFKEPKNQIHAVAFNRKGDLLASGGIQGYLKLWNVADKKILFNVKGHNSRIVDIKFSPNDKLIATSSYDGNILIWNSNNPNDQPVKLKQHEYWVLSLDFNPSGDYLVSGSIKEDRIILWPIKTSDMASSVKKQIKRNFTKEEWNTYIGNDIPYEKTLSINE